MKTIFTLLSILTIGFVHGQNSINYNFITKEAPIVDPVKHGQGTVFRINDINLFMYDVKITSEETEYNTEQPAVFDLLVPEKMTSDNLTEEGNEFINDQVQPSDAEAIEEFSDAKSAWELGDFQMELFQLELDNQKSFADSLQNDNRIQILEDAIINLNQEIEAQKSKIADLNKIIADKYSIELAKLSSEIKTLHDKFEFLERSKMLKNHLISITKTDDLTYDKAIALTDGLPATYPEFLETMSTSVDFDKAFREFKSSYNVFLNSEVVSTKFKADDCKIKESLSPLMEEAESIKLSVSKTDYQKIAEDCQAIYKALRNENNYVAVSDPVQASKDEITFEVKIEPKKDIENLTSTQKREFPIVVPVYGGVKIDFSTGLFLSGLTDRSYSSNPLSTDSTRSTISENPQNNIGQLSIGAMMHVSRRSINYLKPTLSFGLGVNSTDITNLNVFMGGGLVIGQKERFILSGGVSIANIDYLKSQYRLNTEYSTSDLSTELTDSALKMSWFASVTYNLGRNSNK